MCVWHMTIKSSIYNKHSTYYTTVFILLPVTNTDSNFGSNGYSLSNWPIIKKDHAIAINTQKYEFGVCLRMKLEVFFSLLWYSRLFLLSFDNVKCWTMFTCIQEHTVWFPFFSVDKHHSIFAEMKHEFRLLYCMFVQICCSDNKVCAAGIFFFVKD